MINEVMLIAAETEYLDPDFFSPEFQESAQVVGALFGLVWFFYVLMKGMSMGRGGGNVMQSSGLSGGKLAVVALAIIVMLDLEMAIVITNKILNILVSVSETLKDKLL